ncbi:MAG: hypothetical protein GWO02_02930 [Gammaproteobacteria bacterium]|nr:hypothetical protein [Gammaproteobacteria bacterium]
MWRTTDPTGDAPDIEGDCFRHLRRDGPAGQELMVIFPKPWEDDRGRRRLIFDTLDGLEQSARTFHGLGGKSVHDISVVLGTGDHLTEGGHEVQGGLVEHAPDWCGLWVWRAGIDHWRTRGAEKYQQFIAHEVFHCMQFWHFKDQAAQPGRDWPSLAWGRIADWWVEGSAEYFGNVAYPCADDEYRAFVPDFHRLSPRRSILELAYENVVFFQYLGNEMGDAALMALFAALPTVGDLSDQGRLLAAFRDMPDRFHAFGRAYLDREIADSCPGRKVAGAPHEGEELRVVKGEAHEIDAKRFQPLRRRLVFDGGDYTLAYDPEGDPAAAAVKEGDAAWRDPPAHVDSGCEEKRRKLLVTFAVGEPEEHTYTIEETSETVARESRIDRCLVGTWRATDASANAIGRWIAENTSRESGGDTHRVEFIEADGRLQGRFTAGGRALGELDDFVMHHEMHSRIQKLMSDERFKMETTLKIFMSGPSCADYSAQDGEIVMWNIGSEQEARSQVTVRIGDRTFELGGDIPMGGGPGAAERWREMIENMPGGAPADLPRELPTEWSIPYSCRGDTLSVGPPPQLEGAPPWRFRRIGD